MRRDVALRLSFYYEVIILAYIYCIKNGNNGYIGLATGSSETVRYVYKLKKVRERLDRMLQHIDNSYGMATLYGENKETSEGLENALKKGAYTCEFLYTNQLNYGLPSECYDTFKKIWKSSEWNGALNFAELVYSYKFKDSFAAWNKQWGSQGNFKLQTGWFYEKYPEIMKDNRIVSVIKSACKNITWGSPTQRKDEKDLQGLFWPELLIRDYIEKDFSMDFFTIDEYSDALVQALKDAKTKVKQKRNQVQVDIEIDVGKVLSRVVEKKMTKLKALSTQFAKMGLEINIPSEDEQNKLIKNLSSHIKITDGQLNIKGQTVRIPNFITVTPKSGAFQGDPDWMPKQVSPPSKSAQDIVKSHCANRCYTMVKEKGEQSAIGFYTKFLGQSNAAEFVTKSISIYEKQTGQETWTQVPTRAGSKNVAFASNGRRKMYVPREYAQDIIVASRVYDVSDLKYY